MSQADAKATKCGVTKNANVSVQLIWPSQLLDVARNGGTTNSVNVNAVQDVQRKAVQAIRNGTTIHANANVQSQHSLVRFKIHFDSPVMFSSNFPLDKCPGAQKFDSVSCCCACNPGMVN